MIPARQPLASGGVTSSPSIPTKTLLPVPSQSSPTELAKIASAAPRSWAYRNAITLSAYDVVFSPAVAARSLRVHGTTATSAVGGQSDSGAGRDHHGRASRRRGRCRTATARR